MVVRDLRFALDEKGLKALAETLVGQTMTYWEEERLLRGKVVRAEIKRDRYGNPYVEAELEEERSQAPSEAGT